MCLIPGFTRSLFGVWVSFLFIVLTLCSSEGNVHPKVELSPAYSIHEAPTQQDGVPLDVNFTINLRNVIEVNEKAQIISLETSIRMFWKDFRVYEHMEEGKEYITLNPKAAEHF